MKTKDENKNLTGNKQTIKKSGAEKTKKTAGSAFVKTKNSIYKDFVFDGADQELAEFLYKSRKRAYSAAKKEKPQAFNVLSDVLKEKTVKNDLPLKNALIEAFCVLSEQEFLAVSKRAKNFFTAEESSDAVIVTLPLGSVPQIKGEVISTTNSFGFEAEYPSQDFIDILSKYIKETEQKKVGDENSGDLTLLINYYLCKKLKPDESASVIYKKVEMDRKLFSQITSSGTASRNNLIRLAIALELDETETNKLLNTKGYVLTNSVFDSVIRFFISKKNYDYDEINKCLLHFCDEALDKEYKNGKKSKKQNKQKSKTKKTAK